VILSPFKSVFALYSFAFLIPISKTSVSIAFLVSFQKSLLLSLSWYLPFLVFLPKSSFFVKVIKYSAGSFTTTFSKLAFKAIFDFDNVEIGWINFNTGGAPDYRVRRYADGVKVDKPSEEGFKRGFRLVLKLSKECGGDVREFSSNAAACLDGIKNLMDSYDTGSKSNAGKLPVVEFKDSVAKSSSGGALKTTNYVPVWEIVGWVKRPDDLVYTARGSSSSSSSSSSPASTGSTRVSAPADADDFG
jgi:hypothetical protein